MCGPSSQQGTEAQSLQDFSTMLKSWTQQNFGKQSATIDTLNNQYTPIFQAGPDQQGFGPQELAAKTTAATQGVGQNYAKASRALGANLAARGGGNEVLPTGSAAALKGQLASNAADVMSQEQLGITEQNYALGREKWQQAGAGLNALGQMENPNALISETTGASQGAYGEAEQNAMQSTQQFSAIAGGISGMMKSAADMRTSFK